MRIVKMSVAAMLTVFALASCNNEPSTAEDDTVIIKEEPVETGSADTDDDGSSVGFDVETDEEGNVSGKVSGDIDLDDDK